MSVRVTIVRMISVSTLALGVLMWLQACDAAKPPPTAEDLCRFAANTVMLEYWTAEDPRVDPMLGAKEVFGANAKRTWTVSQADELWRNVETLRSFVQRDSQVRVHLNLWLGKADSVGSRRPSEPDRIRGELFSYCLWKHFR